MCLYIPHLISDVLILIISTDSPVPIRLCHSVLAPTYQQLNVSVYVHTAEFIHRREEVSLFSDSEKEIHYKCEIRTGV
jgi:hypothetical protein